MNLTDPTIGTVVVPLLIVAIVAGIKSIFPIKKRASQIVAFFTGITLYSLSFAISAEMIVEPAVSYIVLAVSALAGSLGAMGFYDLTVKPLSRFLSR